jgi:hypothetical protein
LFLPDFAAIYSIIPCQQQFRNCTGDRKPNRAYQPACVGFDSAQSCLNMVHNPALFLV